MDSLKLFSPSSPEHSIGRPARLWAAATRHGNYRLQLHVGGDFLRRERDLFDNPKLACLYNYPVSSDCEHGLGGGGGDQQLKKAFQREELESAV